MAIPEDQLTVWANIGAQVTSKETYATVKSTLESADSGYADKKYKVFLQGSYGNDTNIRTESDVDVVIRLDSVFYYDIEPLPEPQQTAFKTTHPAAQYTYKMFKDAVIAHLTVSFGNVVEPGEKAVLIKPSGNRRKTDVLIAAEFRRYSRYWTEQDESHVKGVCFFSKSDNRRIANFPGLHRDHLVNKNQSTSEWFKHIVRIFKNARVRMIEDKLIEPGSAPSYYLEGLLYNVPTDCFGGSYDASMVKCINWLYKADRSRFRCANEQYLLLDGNPDVSWNSTDCDNYLNSLIAMWNDWDN